MAQKNKIQAILLILILVIPPILYFLFREISHPIFLTVPYQYHVSETGDSLAFELDSLPGTYIDGTPISFASHEGNILLIDFFSLKDTLRTTVLHGNLERVYDNIKDAGYIQMLSINTADTLNSELLEYAEKYESYGDAWQILWMDSAAVRNTGVDQLGIEEFSKWYEFMEKEGKFPEFTSQTIALVDKAGKVRQYFVATDLGQIKRINEDLRALTVLEYPNELRSNREMREVGSEE
ncbi:MAG: hypothetical protein AAF694_15985 [Bacteroidota bacterium]